jgi:spermidine/putrescine transport system ATP-binding protein
MVLDPDVLLLDEPLGALDLKLREAMKIELKLLQHQFNTTFVYITHDQSEALVMSDRVAVMNNGRFEQVGSPQELYHQPATAFVAGFVGDANRWNGRIRTIDGNVAKVETDGGLSVQCTAASGGELALGEKVELFVRPEFISIDRDASSNTADTLAGTVDSLLFNGANSRALVRTNSDELVEADVTLSGGTDDIKPGERVRLSWSADNALCFPATGRPAGNAPV